MRNTISVICVLAFTMPAMASSPAPSTTRPHSYDGRFGTECAQNIGLMSEPVCHVPFVRLIATPERFDGKIISVVGYLIENRGMPELFPNKESFEANSDFENIYIRGPVPNKLQRDIKGGSWVTVIGKFDAKYDGPTWSLGALSDIFSIQGSNPRS